jgi:hypothetical protein
MGHRQRIYQVTEAGEKARANPPVGLSLPCRRILGLVQDDTHFAVIRAGMGMCEEQQVAGWLDELVKAGLVSAQAAADDCDLDFTDSLSLSALAARHNAG